VVVARGVLRAVGVVLRLGERVGELGADAVAEPLREPELHRRVLPAATRLRLVGDADRRIGIDALDRSVGVAQQEKVVADRVHEVQAERHVGSDLALHAEAADVLVGRRVVAVEDGDVRRQRNRNLLPALQRIGVAGEQDRLEVEPAGLEDGGEQRRVQEDLVVVDAEAAADVRLAVLRRVPREVGARSEVLPVVLRVDVVLVVPPQPDVDREIARRAPLVLHVQADDVVAERDVGIARAALPDEGIRVLIVRVERCVGREDERAVEVLRDEGVELDVAVVETRLHEVIAAEQVEAHGVQDLQSVLAQGLRLIRELSADHGRTGDERAPRAVRREVVVLARELEARVVQRVRVDDPGVVGHVVVVFDLVREAGLLRDDLAGAGDLADEVIRRLRVVQPEAAHHGLARRRVPVDLRDDPRLPMLARERRLRAEAQALEESRVDSHHPRLVPPRLLEGSEEERLVLDERSAARGAQDPLVEGRLSFSPVLGFVCAKGSLAVRASAR
jgi:hypothetical protein